MNIEIYSDIACPWCYIGERRFSRARDAFPQAEQVEVVFRPFLLDPSLSEEPIPLKERLQRKFGPRMEATIRHTASVAEEEGLTFRFDEALAVNTFTAHRLLRLALLEYGAEAQARLAEKLFAAHFTRGENVADPALLAGLAASVGMDSGRVEAYLASEEGVEETQEEVSHAQRLGIHAVPTFVFNSRYAVQGAQPTSIFARVLEEVQREAEAADTA